ncbi:hypothetical protein COCVIDRAFT_38691 [Bipolaris victoriae FI3]|uniref:CENP-V/GFA domain-containing protein n=1 Tax=Bipolaris victoriae (strain FI3) TaxID=930091 RepID=W7E6L2_BIPV3|nr:hypothetical protein COCVIDRAFT_38691 [Bipolaris victoriae FI3]
MSLPTLPSPSAPTASYTASCHCGAFTYTVTTSPPLNASDAVIKQCNCSICARNGYMFIYVANERVVFEKGALEEFQCYSFATNKVGHYFCGTCGSSCMLRSKEADFMPGITGINVRMLQDVDLEGIKVDHLDGKSF